MITLDYADKRPIYEQIIDKMRNLIVTGVLKPHDKIPSVRELALGLSINPNTIQKAYHELEAQGYIYSVAAKGNFVSPVEETSKSGTARAKELEKQLSSLVKELKFLGVDKDTLIKLVGDIYDSKKEENADD